MNERPLPGNSERHPNVRNVGHCRPALGARPERQFPTNPRRSGAATGTSARAGTGLSEEEQRAEADYETGKLPPSGLLALDATSQRSPVVFVSVVDPIKRGATA